VIPRVSQTPGFVAGYWLEPLDGEGISVTLRESEQAAERRWPHPAPETHRQRESSSKGSKRGSDRAGLARSRTDPGTSRGLALADEYTSAGSSRVPHVSGMHGDRTVRDVAASTVTNRAVTSGC
jgi:hypothetical protein